MFNQGQKDRIIPKVPKLGEFMITGKLYDWLKWIAQIFLPGVGTLYFTLAGIWGLPNADEIVGTIMAVDLFLGLLLGISQVQYNKDISRGGEFNVFEEADGSMAFSMALDEEPEDLATKKEVHFKVKKRRKPKGRRSMRDQRGVTLIEMLVILAVGLALLAVLFAAGVFK